MQIQCVREYVHIRTGIGTLCGGLVPCVTIDHDRITPTRTCERCTAIGIRNMRVANGISIETKRAPCQSPRAAPITGSCLLSPADQQFSSRTVLVLEMSGTFDEGSSNMHAITCGVRRHHQIVNPRALMPEKSTTPLCLSTSTRVTDSYSCLWLDVNHTPSPTREGNTLGRGG